MANQEHSVLEIRDLWLLPGKLELPPGFKPAPGDRLSLKVSAGEHATLGLKGFRRESFCGCVFGGHLRAHGSVRVCGLDPELATAQIREWLGYFPESTPLLQETVGAVLTVHRAAYARWDPALAAVLLGPVRSRPHARLASLDSEELERVKLCCALAHHPRLVLFDGHPRSADELLAAVRTHLSPTTAVVIVPEATPHPSSETNQIRLRPTRSMGWPFPGVFQASALQRIAWTMLVGGFGAVVSGSSAVLFSSIFALCAGLLLPPGAWVAVASGVVATVSGSSSLVFSSIGIVGIVSLFAPFIQAAHLPWPGRRASRWWLAVWGLAGTLCVLTAPQWGTGQRRLATEPQVGAEPDALARVRDLNARRRQQLDEYIHAADERARAAAAAEVDRLATEAEVAATEAERPRAATFTVAPFLWDVCWGEPPAIITPTGHRYTPSTLPILQALDLNAYNPYEAPAGEPELVAVQWRSLLRKERSRFALAPAEGDFAAEPGSLLPTEPAVPTALVYRRTASWIAAQLWLLGLPGLVVATALRFDAPSPRRRWKLAAAFAAVCAVSSTVPLIVSDELTNPHLGDDLAKQTWLALFGAFLRAAEASPWHYLTIGLSLWWLTHTGVGACLTRLQRASPVL